MNMIENVGCPIRQLLLGQRFAFPSLAKCTCVKPCEEGCHLEGEYIDIFWDRNRDEVLICEECLDFYYDRKCRQMLGIAMSLILKNMIPDISTLTSIRE